MSWPRVFAYGTTYVLSTARGRSLCFPTCPHATGFRRRNLAFFDFSSNTTHVIIAYYCSGDFAICSTAHKRFSICISGVLLRRRRRGIRALRLWSARRVRPVGCAVSMRTLRLPECGTYCAWQQPKSRYYTGFMRTCSTAKMNVTGKLMHERPLLKLY